MKIKTILLIMVSITMLSCTSSDCSNGIQDGTETGIDCGGDCPTCVTYSALETSLQGDWYWAYSVVYGVTMYDNSYSTNGECHANLTLDVSANPALFISYGQLGACTYPTEHSWEVNETTNTINSALLIEEVTADSLKLHLIGQDIDYVYYK